MPSSAGLEFTSVFTYNGSAYTDITREMQSPAGTATAVPVSYTHLKLPPNREV